MRKIEQACVDCWPALYGFLRRSGKSRPEAEDLIQGFLVHCLLRKTRLGSPAPAKGKFLRWLLLCLRRYVISRPAKITHDPHAPGNKPFPLGEDDFDGVEKVIEALTDKDSPDQVYDRMCRLQAVKKTMKQLREYYERRGEADLFAALQPYLLDDGQHGDLKKLAAGLGRSHAGVRTALQRMKTLFGTMLREEFGNEWN
jgi:DNA-directed RNA polymerase specialized sigma24 family protein